MLGAWDVAARARLLAEVERVGSRSKVAKDSGVARPTLISILNGSEPKISTLAQICEALGVTSLYILTGLSEADFRPDLMPIPIGLQSVTSIPILDLAASAGGGVFAGDQVDYVGSIPFPRAMIERIGPASELRIVPVKGDSMEPELRDGDWLMFNQARRELVDGLAVVRKGDALMVKRLRIEGRHVGLISANPYVADDRVDLQADDFEVIGRVVWTGRSFG